MQDTTYLVTIVDRNSFNRKLCTRAFSNHKTAYAWAVAQRNAVMEQYHSQGEDLLDIDFEIQTLDLDNAAIATVIKRYV